MVNCRTNQLNGVAMSSPLALVFANIFMGSNETRWLTEQSKPKIYLRYVNDFLAAFDKD